MLEIIFHAERLRDLRVREGKSCQVLSELLGFGSNTIRRYETGERVPSLRNLCIVARYFGVSVDYFLEYSEKSP